MSWSISISNEGWSEIETTLRTWDQSELARALGCDENDTAHYIGLPHDILVDCAIERIARVNTCDNGGNGYYIDTEGWYRVYTSDTRGE